MLESTRAAADPMTAHTRAETAWGRRAAALLLAGLGLSVLGMNWVSTAETSDALSGWGRFVGALTGRPATRIPMPELEPPDLVALTRDPLAQDGLRWVLEADEAARHAPRPAWAEGTAGKRPHGAPRLRAKAYFVVDHDSGEVLLARNADMPLPIASITKLMGAMIYADVGSDPDEVLTLLWEDKYFLQVTRSKLRVGRRYHARDLLYQVLLSSDNRGMMALTRQTRLPLEVFRNAMNRRAEALGLRHTRFEEPTGLDPRDVSTAQEAALMLEAALQYPRLQSVLASKHYYYERLGDPPARVGAHVTNRLAFSSRWDVMASKTGYTVMSGSCLVTKARLKNHRLVTIAILGARGIDGRYPVAEAIRHYLEADR